MNRRYSQMLNEVTCGDCIDVMRAMPWASVDFILTDPPYLVNYRDRSGRRVANDDNDAWLKPAFRQMYRVLRPPSAIQVLRFVVEGWLCLISVSSHRPCLDASMFFSNSATRVSISRSSASRARPKMPKAARMRLDAGVVDSTIIGILRRNIWSARGFALFQLCGVGLVLLLGARSTLTSADRASLIASAFLTLLLAALFLLTARSLTRAQGKPGRPQAWIAVSVFFVLPWFFLQAFSISSAAMEDTLLVGDSVLVQRWPKPVVGRGDVIVFPYPLDPHEDFVKRIVGVPGDRLRIANKILYRNGAPVIEPYAVHKTTYVDAYRDNFPSQPNTRLQPPALDMLASHAVNDEVVVPAGKYFVMGDNRDDSLDSRYFGFVDAATVLGKPILIYNSIDRPNSDTLGHQRRGLVRWNRLFRILR
jgi:signal peptidase I